MTSRLTLTALLFSLLSTAALVWTAEADAATDHAAVMRTVQLERVVIVGKRIGSDN